jgi:hypothetical protein
MQNEDSQMHRSGINEGDVRGAADAAPRSDPLRLVEDAVSGHDLPRVVAAAAEAIGCSVAISLPALNLWAQSTETLPASVVAAVQGFASAVIDDPAAPQPAVITAAALVHLAGEIVGVVVAVRPPEGEAAGSAVQPLPVIHSWLDAAAAAAAVTALVRGSAHSSGQNARRAFLELLEARPGTDFEFLLSKARQLGYDFSAGAIAICASSPSATLEEDSYELSDLGLVAALGGERLIALIPLATERPDRSADQLLEIIHDHGLQAIKSAPRRGPSGVGAALREASVLLELALDPMTAFAAQEETYRLLVGVLIHDSEELLALKERTVANLERYDAAHETDLLRTLDAFLSYHGSTTDTASALKLHRHTVGYRLARVQAVTGLSPYESEGRERLSLGLKAHRILEADQRRSQRLGRHQGL